MPRVVAVWHRWCSGRRRARLWGRAAGCAGGRRPAREPSAPRAFGSARRLEARPGPATAHRHRGQALRSLRRPPHQWRLRCAGWLGAAPRSPARPRRRPPHRRRLSLIGGSVLCLETRPDLAFAPQASSPALAHIAAESTPNVARNSPATLSNIEFRSLELQRFLTLLELYPIELRATFLGVCPTVVVMSQAVPFWCSVGSCWFAMLRACCCGVVCGLCLVRTWACWLKEMSPWCGCVECVVKESSPLHGENGRILVVYGVLGR